MQTAGKIDILLVGFGAVGVVYAYLLEKSGEARVTAVARSNLDLVRANGIRIDAPGKWGLVEHWRPSRLVQSVEEAADTDYAAVVVTTKALPDVLPTEVLLKPLIDAGRARTFLLIQNGLGIEQGLYDATRGIDATILSSVCHISTNLIGNRDEHILDDAERLIVGVYHPPSSYTRPAPTDVASNTTDWLPQDSPAQTEALETMLRIIRAGGGNVEVERDVELFRFHKVIFNSTWAALACLTRSPLEDFLPVLDVVGPSVLALLEEVALIGRTANLPFAPGFAQTHFDATVEQRRRGGRHRPSALVDILTGRPFEVQCTIGNVLQMGRRVGVPDDRLPLLRLVHGLAQVIQRGQLAAGA